MQTSSPTIHLWMPGLFDFKGGIQTYSAFFLNALQQICPQAQLQVFLMHDAAEAAPSIANTQFRCAGHVPLRLRTVASATQMVSLGLWQRPDLVITTHLNFTVAAYWLKQLAGIPYWAVAHGFEAWNVERPELRRAIAHADRILSVSSYTRDRLLQEQSLHPNQVSLLPNTFDASRFNIAPKPEHLLKKHHLKPDQPVILTVNRLAAGEAYHAYDRVLAALPYIRQHIPNIHYIIVGKGSDRARLENLIAQQKLQDCVTLAGFIPDEELGHYYNLCDVFAMPGKLEGFGIVFLEAMAAGKPVLGSAVDGSVDALAQGALGALVDPDDAGAIAQTLVSILQGDYPNPLLYQPEALRQAAINTFGTKRFRQTLAQLMQQSPFRHQPFTLETPHLANDLPARATNF